SEYRQKAGNIRDELPKLRTFFLPMLFVTLGRSFLLVSITTYLPTFLNFEGASFQLAGISLAVLEAAGVIGALSSGTISDKLGRKPVVYITFAASSILLFTFLQVEGWFGFVILAALGFFSLSPQPVLLAMVQDQLPNNRAAANGLYMLMAFLVRSLVLVTVGALGDSIGLRDTFLISAGVSLIAIPAMFVLPNPQRQPAQ
ncbi:MAG TPA: MFS transporter, partial [Anaerolineales bacterium]|nr:MFS transporter [Anaerolineales bacterium]